VTHPSRLRSLALTLVVVVVVAGGCDSGPQVPDGPPPTLGEIAPPYNERVGGLDRVWARATVRVSGPDGEGGRRVDQGEGYLFYSRPRDVGLQVGKYIDRMYFHLGSNEEWFWWIDVLDRDQRVALIGRHEEATRAEAERFGVPVHPLDLRELVGVTPLESEGEAPEWATRGEELTIALDRSARWGTQRLYLDPVTYYPVRIELRTPAGRLAAASDLSGYRLVHRVGQGPLGYIAESIAIELPQIETRVDIDLAQPRNDPDRPKEIVFSLDRLLDAYRIPAENVRRLGAPVSRAE